jgi:hypothetical protein
MASITLKGNPINTCGELPAVGSDAADFCLTATDLADVSLKDYEGKTIIMNIFPSLDTGVCAASVKKFNDEIHLKIPFAFAYLWTCLLLMAGFVALKESRMLSTYQNFANTNLAKIMVCESPTAR